MTIRVTFCSWRSHLGRTPPIFGRCAVRNNSPSCGAAWVAGLQGGKFGFDRFPQIPMDFRMFQSISLDSPWIYPHFSIGLPLIYP